MAQFFFQASDYADGEKLIDIGFTELGAGADSAKATFSGVEYFNVQSTFTQPRNEVLEATDGAGDQEVLVLFDAPVSNYISSGSKSMMIALRDTIGLKVDIKTTNSIVTGNNISGTVNLALPALDDSKAAAMRARVVGDLYELKVWQADVGTLEANEPVGWNWSATQASPASGRAGFHKQISAWRATHIGIGTNGDSAPFSAPPAPIVATPTPLSADQITATSARLNWSV